MTHTHADQTLSLLEQAILVRLPRRGSIRLDDLVSDITTAAASVELSENARATVDAAIAGLRHRGLVDDKVLRSTTVGEKVLREALGARRVPTWPQFCNMLAARALGLSPGSNPARRTLATRDALALAVLRQRTLLPAGNTITEVADALIVEVLGLPPGKLSLARIRQHALARRIGSTAASGPFAAAASAVQAQGMDKASLVEAMARSVIEHELTPCRPTLEGSSVTRSSITSSAR